MAMYEAPPFAAQTAAGADQTVLLGVVEPQDGQGNGVDRMVVTAPSGFSTVTGANTNNVQISVRQVRAGSAVGTIGTLVFNSGTNLTAENPVAIPVTTPPTLQAGDVLDAVMHQNGTGLAVGAGVIVQVTVN